MMVEEGLQLQLPDFEESDFYVEQEQVSTPLCKHVSAAQERSTVFGRRNRLFLFYVQERLIPLC